MRASLIRHWFVRLMLWFKYANGIQRNSPRLRACLSHRCQLRMIMSQACVENILIKNQFRLCVRTNDSISCSHCAKIKSWLMEIGVIQSVCEYRIISNEKKTKQRSQFIGLTHIYWFIYSNFYVNIFDFPFLIGKRIHCDSQYLTFAFIHLSLLFFIRLGYIVFVIESSFF